MDRHLLKERHCAFGGVHRLSERITVGPAQVAQFHNRFQVFLLLLTSQVSW